MPRIILPTRITSTSATVIDHIYHYSGNYKNADTSTWECGNIYSDITDHMPNWIIAYKEVKNKLNFEKRPLIRLFTSKNKINFRNSVKMTNWADIMGSDSGDVNVIYNKFLDTLNKNFDENFPKVKLSIRGSKDENWMTSGL